MNSQMPPPRQAIASQSEAGKTCPYCRFPLKEGSAIVQCGSCEATHHADCWQENGGCTVVGCVAGSSADTVTKVSSPLPSDVAMPPQSPPAIRARHTPWLAIAVLVLAFAIVGTGVAFITSNNKSDATSGETDPPAESSGSADGAEDSAVDPNSIDYGDAVPSDPDSSDFSDTDPADSDDTSSTSSGSAARSDVPEYDGYVAQIGSYKRYVGAEASAAQLSESGLSTRILRSSDIEEFKSGYWVVYVGPFDSESEADRAARTANRYGAKGAFSRFATVK